MCIFHAFASFFNTGLLSNINKASLAIVTHKDCKKKANETRPFYSCVLIVSWSLNKLRLELTSFL